ncbi:hypothetical protein JYT87_01350 [Nitrospira defluvii]|nr:hypothetical protein [Nitrospira defluvii]
MSWLEFIAKIIDSLVWPASILFVLFILRGELPAIARSLKKLRYKDLELEFEKSAQEIVEKAKLSLPETSKNIQLSGQSQDELIDRLVSISELAPRSAILEAWLVVEAAAVDVAKKKGISTFKSYPGPMRLRDYLVKGDLLNKDQQAVFEQLRNLRNEAVHVADAEFTRKAVDDYIASALQMAGYLEKKANEL